MLDFCKSSGFRILNGRINESKSDNFTCFTANGSSIVDYALCMVNLFDRISSLEIGSINELSDHAPIEIAFRTNVDMSRKHDSPSSSSKIIKDSNLLINELSDNYLYRFTPNEDTPERLMHSLESDGVKDFLDHITNDLDDPQVPVEVSVANLHRKLLENQKVPFPQKFYLRKKEKGNLNLYLGSSPLFDESCRLAKTKLNKSRKQYQTAMKYLSRWG